MTSPFSNPSSEEDWKAVAEAQIFIAEQLRHELETQFTLKIAVKRALFRLAVKIVRTLG